MGSDYNLAISNGSEHHSELQIFSFNICEDEEPITIVSLITDSGVAAISSVGISENNIIRLS